MFALRQIIPRNATFAVRVGVNPPVEGIILQAVPLLFQYWLLPRRYTDDAHAADWVITFNHPAATLGVAIRHVFRLSASVSRRRGPALTHAYAGLAAFDVTLTIVGYALLYGLGFVRRRGQILPCLGLAFFGGWATTAVLLSLGVTIGTRPGPHRTFSWSRRSPSLCRCSPAAGSPRLTTRSPSRSTSLLGAGTALAGAGILVLDAPAALCARRP